MIAWVRLGGRRGLIVIAVAVIVTGAGTVMSMRAGTTPDVPMTTVTRGDFVDFIQIRGEIRPEKSIVLSAPLNSGELQIVKIVKNGSTVKGGDVLVEFDSTQLRQRLAERQSDLKQADGEIAQTIAQSKISQEEDQAALTKAKYDVERAKLDLGKRDLVSRIEYEQAKLALVDAEQKFREAEAKVTAGKAGVEADLVGKRRKREKALADVERTQRSLDALQIRSPAAGVVNILNNPRSGGPFGGGVEFREGDRAWPGANILELPDLSSVHVEARLEEADRGRLRVGQPAMVRIEAVPGHDFAARVDLISVLAKVDFSSGWPPARNFDLGVVLQERDPRIRPGMSATARIAAGRVPGMLIVPAEAVFQHDGRPVVYRLHGSRFDEQRVEIAHRGREQAAISSGVAAGDRVATRKPDPEQIRRTS
jgi:multidrug efflux pump subunit AcrA (membrane-fusion protein)